MKDIRQKLLATFQIEHRDHVEQIRSLLAMVGKTAAQPESAELEEVFRRAHSLKGAARAVDLRSVEGLAHRMETLFSRVRHGELLLDKEVAGVVQQVLDASEDCVAAFGEDRPATDFGSALQAIERILGMESEAPPSPAPPETQPPLPAFQPLEMVRITAQNFDGLLRSSGGLLSESLGQNQVSKRLNEVARGIASIEKEGERARRAATSALSRPGTRIEVSRMNSFFDAMQRQVRTVSRQANAVRRLQQRSSWTVRHLGKQLQRDVWQARMVPAESLMEGYRKMMRDLARDEAKEIEFRAVSSGVHADRRVLEALKDPVMHLLRNAVSHGIETPKARAAKGKSPSGLVTLRVDSNGQRLIIAIQDDGMGVDFSRVAEAAVRSGILSQAQAGHSSPEDLARILFRPGFTTSRSVTDLSGRGMGLSVVYEAVRRLQGDLEIRPADGGGTAVHLSVPLSISTHRLLLVSCGSQLFAIPIHGVERLHRVKFECVETLEGKPVITLNRQPVPLFSLRQLMGLDPSPAAGAESLQIMLLRSGSQRVAVAVGAFLGENDAVIQDLGPAAGRKGKVSSGVLLEDGSIAFVLNPMELLKNSVTSHASLFTKSAEPAPKKRSASILVVDDSLTTRTLEKSILEAQGYRVRVAVDGMEALALLHAEGADLVIADIEMPRLNGFGLIEAMKKDKKLERIPVIIVSSVEHRKDQERGLALGADAYIVKRKFDQEELLTTIRQIL